MVYRTICIMKTILIIEDESALQKTLEDALSQEGYEAVSALDGEAGVRLAKYKMPDLILLDLVLTKMTGFEVLERLKAEKGTQKIPVIVLTNLENLQDIQRATELGASTYLVKSNYELAEIVEKVKTALKEV